MTVARRRAIDGARHRRVGDDVANQLAILADEIDEHEAGGLPDRRLALLFACTHPALEAAVRTPLMLQVVLGLDAKTIASAFLTSPAAMSKRLVRAKNKIREAGIPFCVPEREELPGRLAAVLEAVYAAYTEGWTDPVGSDTERRDLAGEALFLADMLAELLPAEPETLGLFALMLYAQARRDARRDAAGDYVPLSAQNPATWNAAMIAAADALLRRASAFNSIGRFQLEAALQSAHIHRCTTHRANWDEIVQLYDALLDIAASPVVAVNRALAVAERDSPQAALDALAPYADDPRLMDYQPYWAARADLLARAGATAEAFGAYDLAIGLASDPAVRRFLQRKQMAL
jgi:RNA polymerase sigma-70 factor (ECF subfamily)